MEKCRMAVVMLMGLYCIRRFAGFIAVMLFPLFLYASELPAGKDYADIVSKVSSMTVGRVVSEGDRVAERGQADEALVLYMIACGRLADGMADAERQQCAIAHLKVGNVYYKEASYATALEYYVKGLRIYESCEDQKEIGRFYNNIGNIYCVFQDFEKGADYYRQGYAFCRKYGDRVNEYKLLVNMSGICTFTGDTESARKYYYASEKLMDRSDPGNIFMSWYNHALILMTEKKYRQAIDLFRRQVDYGMRHRLDPRYICHALQYMYRAYGQLGMRDSTLAYLRLCRQMAESNSMMPFFVDVLKDYSDLYEEKGDMARSKKYLTKYIVLRDSIYNMREFDVVKNMQAVYEMDKTARQISAMREKEKERQETIRMQHKLIVGALGGLSVIAVFLIVVYRQNRRLDKSYTDLFEVNRNFVKSQEHMRLRIKALKEELRSVKEMPRTVCGGQGEADGALPADRRKYRSSPLCDSQKKILAEAITNVMENGQEFCKPDFSLGRLAELVESNSKYVSQVINDTFHKNFSDYVNEYRVHLVCSRLVDTGVYGNYTVKAVAESAGFKSYSTFIAVFRKITGLTPSLYQEKARGSVRT